VAMGEVSELIKLANKKAEESARKRYVNFFYELNNLFDITEKEFKMAFPEKFI